MKKFLITLIITISSLGYGYSQYLVPVSVSTNPEEIEMTVLGAFGFDGASGDFSGSLTSQADFGYILNALVRRKAGRWGAKTTYKQFILNINPVIIDWKPFVWNTLTTHPIDSFSVEKLPFSDNSLLHIGVRHNSIAKIKLGGDDQKNMHSFWADLFWSPSTYTLTENEIEENLRFQTFNVNFGYQYSFFKRNVPVVDEFLIGFSPQMNFTLVNESQNYQGSFQKAVETNENYRYAGQNYMGFGGKLIVQIRNLNVFVEGRQYMGLDKGYKNLKFSDEPTFIVGAFANVKFFTRSPKKSGNGDNGGWQ